MDQIQTNLGEEGLTEEQWDWAKAMQELQKIRRFPTCSEVLELAHALGYRKVEPAAKDIVAFVLENLRARAYAIWKKRNGKK